MDDSGCLCTGVYLATAHKVKFQTVGKALLFNDNFDVSHDEGCLSVFTVEEGKIKNKNKRN